MKLLINNLNKELENSTKANKKYSSRYFVLKWFNLASFWNVYRCPYT